MQRLDSGHEKPAVLWKYCLIRILFIFKRDLEFMYGKRPTYTFGDERNTIEVGCLAHIRIKNGLCGLNSTGWVLAHFYQFIKSKYLKIF